MTLRQRSPRTGTFPTVSALVVLVPLFFLFLSSPQHAAYATEVTADFPSPVDALPAGAPLSEEEIKLGGDDDVLSFPLQSILLDDETPENDGDGSIYEPDFGVFDRSILGRAPPGVTALANNVPEQLNVDPGQTQVFVFEKTSIFAREDDGVDAVGGLELRKRESELDGEDNGRPTLTRRASTSSSPRLVYISANTCLQPQAVLVSSGSASSSASSISSSVATLASSAASSTASPETAPQLIMYISTSADNISPGPHADAKKQTRHVFMEGAVMVGVNATDDVYIGISAPNVSTKVLSGTYNFQLAASMDEWYHSYDNETDANLIWVDSDASAALLYTHNLTESKDAATQDELMSRQPYVMFAQNEAYEQSVRGVRFSYCGLENYAQIAATSNGKLTSTVNSSMTRAGLGNLPKQQFYFSGLNASSKYVGILAALPQNGTVQQTGLANVVGGGGKVAQATSFETKSEDSSCQVVLNLDFCNETAYAVPSNVDRFTTAEALAKVYDDYAASMYATFEKVLAQVPCEAPTVQRYSLVRSCDDCAAAYKNWLCSVAIPRCADFSDNSTWLQPRAVGQTFPRTGTQLDPLVLAQFPNTTAYNASRNPFIDETVGPGPYKEVLPCNDLCYNLVKSCPSSIGFSCPLPGYQGFNTSYGLRTSADKVGLVTCNYPGSAHFFSAGPAAARLSLWSLAVAAGSGLVLAFQ